MKLRLVILLTFSYVAHFYAQELDKTKNYFLGCVAFYNIENLYDTIDNPENEDTDFTPTGKYFWNSERYRTKLEHLSEVISQLGTEATPDGPAIIGMCEIENKSVLVDLVATEKLKNKNYGIVHYNSPDRRGVDVALLYQKAYFKVTNSVKYKLSIESDTSFRSRDMLLVSGIFHDEPMHFIVCHWPSRRGGNSSIPLRIKAADVARSIIDSVLKTDPNAKIMMMGDLNDDPVDKSIKQHIKTSSVYSKSSNDKLFNPAEEVYKKGVGSLAYKDSWNLFDQMIITPAFCKNDYSTYQYYKYKVFNKKFVSQDEGSFKGYPFRTYVGETYGAGYSDHFAVYTIIAKERK